MSSGERQHSKLEEALEVKSLRRIISAYLNYSDAAEEDVRRYERSYKKLPPAHKAFEPPLDMNQEIDICEHEHLEDANVDHLPCEGRDFCSCQSASTSGRTCFAETDQARGGIGSNLICNSQKEMTINEEVQVGDFCGSANGNMPLNSDYSRQYERAGSDDVKVVNNDLELNVVYGSNRPASPSARDWLDPSLQLKVPLVDVDKVRCIIRNIVRDWAPEGQRERDQCYKPILEELDRLFPDRCKDRPPSCLVPGAGLGRLALDISCFGFISQGNEFSYYMMICSSFILNHTQSAGEWTIYPWIHSNCNSFSDKDQLRPVSFPDIHPASAGITEGFSMCGGDFVEVYSDPSQEGAWDAVVTCFFLDTAHNIVEYIEIISRVLKEGGVWINLGPLLYHFADMYGPQDEMSIELSLEDVKRVAFHYGFQLEKEKTIETTYTANLQSMMQNRYYAAFWTMTKRQVKS